MYNDISTATRWKKLKLILFVEGPDRVTYPMSIMLGVVTALLTIVVVILVLKIRKLQTGKIAICCFTYSCKLIRKPNHGR